MGKTDADWMLVKHAQGGNKKAFDLLVLKYQHKLIAFVSRYIHESSEVLDVTQESFVKAYQALPDFRGDSMFCTWLYRIAVNTAKNHVNSRRWRQQDAGVDLVDPKQYRGKCEPKNYETLEHVMLTEAIKKTVTDAIDQLPEVLKTAITLRELQGLSYEQIAQVIKCPLGTVRSRIFKAREAIIRKLEPQLH